MKSTDLIKDTWYHGIWYNITYFFKHVKLEKNSIYVSEYYNDNEDSYEGIMTELGSDYDCKDLRPATQEELNEFGISLTPQINNTYAIY